MKAKLLLLTLTATLLFAATVRADPVILTIIPNPAAGAPGEHITLSVAFTNLCPDLVRLESALLSQAMGPGTAQFLPVPDPFLGRVVVPGETVVARFIYVFVFPTAREGQPIVFDLTVNYAVLSPAGTIQSIEEVTTASTVKVVPEPATMLLLGTGLAGVAIKTRKRLRRKRAQRSP